MADAGAEQVLAGIYDPGAATPSPLQGATPPAFDKVANVRSAPPQLILRHREAHQRCHHANHVWCCHMDGCDVRTECEKKPSFRSVEASVRQVPAGPGFEIRVGP